MHAAVFTGVFNEMLLQNEKEFSKSGGGDSPKKLGNLQSESNRVKRHLGDSDEEEIYRRTNYQDPQRT